MIQALIIDDDANLRKGLRRQVEKLAPWIQILGECGSVDESVKSILQLSPNLLFLDVHLVDGTGFDVLEQVKQAKGAFKCQIIFITAHEQYALKAFKFSALDYLLKPVDEEDLEKVLSRVKEMQNTSVTFDHLNLLLENITRKNEVFKKIALSTSDGIHLISISDIIRCESSDNYTTFHLNAHKPLVISKTLKEYEDLFADQGFERIHQSHLINLTYLKSYLKNDGGFVMMQDGSKLPVSQRKKDRLLEIIRKMDYK